MSKPTKESNNTYTNTPPTFTYVSTNTWTGTACGFVIDMGYKTLFNRLCWIHRNEASGSANMWGLNYHGVDVWGTDDYRGPTTINVNPTASQTLSDPNTVWTFIKRVDFGIDRNGNPTTDGWVPQATYNPPLPPTNNQWQVPLREVLMPDGTEPAFRYVKIQAWKLHNTNNNKACVSDFRLYYYAEQ